MRFLTLEDFQPHVGTVFVGLLADSEVPFQLVEVQPLQSSAEAQRYRQPFSLVFRNESAVLFPQQTYSMRHPGSHCIRRWLPISSCTANPSRW